MNKLTIIGNLTRDPELRTTQTGVSVCTFTVAVNRRKTQNQQQPEADFFRVTVWRERGETCAKWLVKGKKVCVVGPVSVSTYTGNDGKAYANLEVTAEEVEFLTPAGQVETQEAAPTVQQPVQQTVQQQMPIAGGFTPVESDELPF